MPPRDPDIDEIIEGYLATSGGAIVKAGLDGDLPQDVLDAAQDLLDACQDQIAAGRQLRRDLDDLNRRRDLIPRDGYQRLVADAKRDARSKVDDADTAAKRALTRLEESLFEAALPKFQPEREQLARDECALALSNGDPQAAALGLADHGNDEALAALLSPWGRTLLEARGVRNVDRMLADVRTVVRGRIIARADTPAAVVLRDHLSDLATAKGQAGYSVRQLAGHH